MGKKTIIFIFSREDPDHMARISRMYLLSTLLLILALIAGCTSEPAAPVPATTNPPTAQTVVVTTTLTETATPVPPVPVATITKATTVPVAKVIVTDKGIVTPDTFKTYDLEGRAGVFSRIGDKYTITIKADKPVLGYAVDAYQAQQLQGSLLTPQYLSQSSKVNWGLVKPFMVMEKVTNSEETFTISEIHPYVYVIDGRWMGFDENYKSIQGVNYELTITKTPNPASQHGANT